MEAERINAISNQLADLSLRVKNSGGIFDYPAKERKLSEVNAALEDPKVWDDPKRAQELGKEKKSLEDVVLVIDRLTTELADNTELFEMCKRRRRRSRHASHRRRSRHAGRKSRRWNSAGCSTTRPTR